MIYSQEYLLAETYEKSVCEVRVNAPNAYFVNLADIHQGLNHRAFFQQWLKFLFSIPNLYIGIGGDAGNGVTRGSKGNPLEEWASGSKQLYALAEDLRPWADSDRLLYIIDGNHLAGRMKDDTFHTPEELLAWLLGKPELYKGPQAITYFNVNKQCYIHFAQHQSNKRLHHFDWVNADVTWREHIHENHYQYQIVMEHNKFVKKPIIKRTLSIQSGHWLIGPEYMQTKGYRPTLAGCWIVEMSGSDKRDIKIWSNEQLWHMVGRGYQV